MRPKNCFCTVLVFAVIIGLVAISVNAETERFTVHPYSEVTRSLDLKENDRVSIGFTVIGESTNELDFRVTDPDGKTIMRCDRVGQISSSFSATKTGAFLLHFDNSPSSETKSVTLYYSIQHYIMGIPQTLFLVMAIAVILVIAVAVFVLMGKTTY